MTRSSDNINLYCNPMIRVLTMPAMQSPFHLIELINWKDIRIGAYSTLLSLNGQGSGYARCSISRYITIYSPGQNNRTNAILLSNSGYSEVNGSTISSCNYTPHLNFSIRFMQCTTFQIQVPVNLHQRSGYFQNVSFIDSSLYLLAAT